ncbi:hypothetical protein [uncultured Formosa sp.]|uniref:hypothetical protein n=1 Tax=uncultured Formosa sp. TaxID=255435 RepID=UPI002617E303|nr:hypothetical protein [uncultured Formosa sp.]
MNDTTVSVIIVIILISHILAITIGYKIKKTIVLISCLNAFFSIGILVFLVTDTLNVKEYQFQFRELFVLCLEVCILIFALYSIPGFYNKTYVKVINYIGFGIHILVTLGMFIFMYAFKLNHLF